MPTSIHTSIEAKRTRQLQAAATYFGKAMDLLEKKDYGEALKEFRQAQVIREAIRGVYDQITAQTSYQIGWTLFHLEKWQEALHELEKAYETQERELGFFHIETIATDWVIQEVLTRNKSRTERGFERLSI
jgi:tetratricopeptide (TPR) repeat protein